MKFSKNGRYLATGGQDCAIHVWEVISNRGQATEEAASPASSPTSTSNGLMSGTAFVPTCTASKHMYCTSCLLCCMCGPVHCRSGASTHWREGPLYRMSGFACVRVQMFHLSSAGVGMGMGGAVGTFKYIGEGKPVGFL
jgi:hypothetical protein